MNPNIVAHLISLLIFAVIQFAFLPITAAYVWLAYIGVGLVCSIQFGLMDKQVTTFTRNSTITSKLIGWSAMAAIAACIWTTTPFGMIYVIMILITETIIQLGKT